MVLEKTLESPLDCKEIKPVSSKGNQPRIFIGRTDADAEPPVLWPLMWTTDSLEKTLMLGKIEGRRRGRQRMRWSDGITDSMDMSSSKIWKIVKDRESWHAAVHGAEKSQTWQRLSDNNLMNLLLEVIFSKHFETPNSSSQSTSNRKASLSFIIFHSCSNNRPLFLWNHMFIKIHKKLTANILDC